MIPLLIAGGVLTALVASTLAARRKPIEPERWIDKPYDTLGSVSDEWCRDWRNTQRSQ